MEELKVLPFHFSLWLDEITTLSTVPSFWILFVVWLLALSKKNSYFVKSIFCQLEVWLEERSRYQIQHLWRVAAHPVILPCEEWRPTHSLPQSLCSTYWHLRDQRLHPQPWKKSCQLHWNWNFEALPFQATLSRNWSRTESSPSWAFQRRGAKGHDWKLTEVLFL